jgi:hypothetical protein
MSVTGPLVQKKLWNYCNSPRLGRSLARSPVTCAQVLARRPARPTPRRHELLGQR